MFTLKTTAAVALLALAASAQAATGLQDGTFIEGATANGYQTYGATQSIGPWTVTSGSVDLIGSYWQQPTTGGYSIDLDGNSAGAITQTFMLAAGDYTLGFWMAANPDGGLTAKTVKVSAGLATDTFVFTPTASNTRSNMGYTFETLTFTTAGSTTVSFESLDGASPYGAAIGGISVSAVPEPASLGLLLAGIGMIGVMSSRRRVR